MLHNSQWQGVDQKAAYIAFRDKHGKEVKENRITLSRLEERFRSRRGLSYVDREIERASRHCDFAAEKLADRIIKKGMVISNITLSSSKIDSLNIETVITDGNLTVKAWTIIAEGLIQCPHYRYLVK